MPRKGLLVIGLLAILLGGGGYYLYSSRTQADVNLADKGTAISIWSNNAKVQRQVPLTIEFHFSKSSSTIGIFHTSSNKNDIVKKRVVSTNDSGDYRLSSTSYKKLSQAEIKAVLESFLSDALVRTLTDEEKAYIQELAAAINNPNASSSSAASSKSSSSSASSATAAVSTECQKILSLLQKTNGVSAEYLDSLNKKCPSTVSNLAGVNGSVLVSNLLTEYQDQIVVPKGYKFAYAVVNIISDRFSSADTKTIYFSQDKYVNEAKFNVTLGQAESANISEAATKFVAKLNALDPDVAAKDGYQNLFDAFQRYMLSGSLYGYTTADNDAAILALVQKYLNSRSAFYSSVNMVKNGGFEDGVANWELHHDGAAGREQVVSTGCKGGSKCIELVPGGDFQAALQFFGKLEPGKYQFSAYYKTVGTAAPETSQVSINLRETVSKKSYNIGMNGSTEWKKILTEVEIPSADNAFIIYLYADKSGKGSATVYFDNVELNKI